LHAGRVRALPLVLRRGAKEEMGKGKGEWEARTRNFSGAVVPVCWLIMLTTATAIAGCGDDGGEAPSVTPSRSRTQSATRPSATPLPTPVVTPALPAETTTAAPGPAATPGAQPQDISVLTVVDKQRVLPAGYIPPDLVGLDAGLAAPGFGGLLLRAEAAGALSRMLSAATAAGHDIRVRSAYRSYAEQERTFAYWVSVLGEAEARRVSAEAGHSEHQLGTAADLSTSDVGYDLTETFGDTPAGRWLAANAHIYGFALSYPPGAEDVTGYAYEPWHYRYIGTDHAQAWRASGLTLIAYLRGLE
jgi:D-alanyl-D-alanine carboxypeptidase